MSYLTFKQEARDPMWRQMPENDMPFVRKLTGSGIHRRRGVTRRLTPCLLATFVGFLLAQTANGQVEPQKWQPVEQISTAAEAFLRQRTGVFDGNTSVHARNLDARQRLPYCTEPLQAFMRAGKDIAVRNIVGVRCSGDKPWKVYVPVDVVVVASVLVARQTLIKGQTITADDLKLEQRDVSRLRNGYLSDPERVIGLRLKTQLIAGKTLKPSMLAADITIRRGQSVTLTVVSGGFSIRMNGTALMDGAINQRIRVKNDNSGRIVEGIVRSHEQVEIAYVANHQFFNAKPKVSPRMADTRLSNNDR